MLSAIANGLGNAGRQFGVTILNATVPSNGYRLEKNLAFGAGPRDVLDLYVPKDVKSPPLVLFLYGGGWTEGRKDIYPFLAEALASAGIAVAVADYRLHPEVTYPAFLEDNASALRFLRKEGAKHGVDTQRLFLAGHSAGAYNAVMLAVDRRRLSDEDRASLRGIIGISGLYDFLPIKNETTVAVFGGDRIKDTQPIEHVDRPVAPMLLATGLRDDVVDPGNTSRFAQRLRSVGSEVAVREYETAGHIDIIVSLARGFRGRTSLRADIISFVEAQA